MRKLRLTLAVVFLVVSLIVLGWGLWPMLSEPHILWLTPSEMTPPTPSSFVPAIVRA